MQNRDILNILKIMIVSKQYKYYLHTAFQIPRKVQVMDNKFKNEKINKSMKLVLGTYNKVFFTIKITNKTIEKNQTKII